MEINQNLSFLFKVFKRTLSAYDEDRCLKFSAALAYYTIFSLAPMLILMISVFGFFFGREAIQGEIIQEIGGFVGIEGAKNIQLILQKAALSPDSSWALVVGIVTLLFGATGVFIEIQDSINYIWRVKAVPEKGWLKFITNRLLSLSMIAGLGFLLIVSLLINSLVLILNTQLQKFFPGLTILVLDLTNSAITFLILVALCSTIYKVLPDVEVSWRQVRSGAIFTALLFMIGKTLIGYYIQSTSVGSVFGAASSLVVIVVWVYYSAAILYFGAELTQAFIQEKGDRIKPSKHAVHLNVVVEEKYVNELPQNLRPNS